jgi:hypothetical protein
VRVVDFIAVLGARGKRLRDPMARVGGEVAQLGTPQHRQDCWRQPRGEPDGFARP